MSPLRIFAGSKASNQNGSRTYKERNKIKNRKKKIGGKRHVDSSAKEDSVHEDLCALY